MLAFDPGVVPAFPRFLRDSQELSRSRDIAMPNQFRLPRQKPLGGMSPCGQFGNRRREPPTAGRTPKLRDAHPQFHQRQVPHTIQVARLMHLVTDAAAMRTHRDRMFRHDRQPQRPLGLLDRGGHDLKRV